jgi:hypothetical protein
MKEGYKVNPTIGNGLFIEVYNFIGLNEVGQYRFIIQPKEQSDSIVGIWKPKTK